MNRKDSEAVTGAIKLQYMAKTKFSRGYKFLFYFYEKIISIWPILFIIIFFFHFL